MYEYAGGVGGTNEDISVGGEYTRAGPGHGGQRDFSGRMESLHYTYVTDLTSEGQLLIGTIRRAVAENDFRMGKITSINGPASTSAYVNQPKLIR